MDNGGYAVLTGELREACIRCSKQYAAYPDLVCWNEVDKASAKCADCRAKNKPCHSLPATFLGEGGHLHHLQRTADEKGAGGALDACQKRFTQMLESEAAKERAELKDAVKNPAAYAAKRADQAADRIVASLDRILPVVRGVAETLKHVEKKLDNNALATRLPAPVARLVACAGASRPSSNVLPRSEAAATSCAQPQSSARPANCCTISLPVNPALEKAASERSAAYAELKRTEKAKKAKRIADAALEKEVQSQETSKEPDIEAEVTEQLHPSK